MATISQFAKFVQIAERHMTNEPPEKFGYAVRAVIDDAIFDIAEAGKIVTRRLYDVAAQGLNTDKQTAKKIVDEFGKWLKSNPKHMIDESEESINSESIEMINEDIEYSEINEVKGRVQTLRGRDAKKREAKAKVMKLMNSDTQFMAAKKKLLDIANRLAKKYAREAGVSPALINVDKVTIRRDDKVTKKPEQKETKKETNKN